MCPTPPRRAARRLALLAAAALACAPGAAAGAPSADDLRAERDRLAARERALDGELQAARAALAAERARLDDARAEHRRALARLERRLVAVYVTPEPSPLAVLLTGDGLADARARLDLLRAVGEHDRALVAAHRRALARLRAAEAAAGRRKAALAAARERLAARRGELGRRLAGARRRERAAAPAPAGPVLSPAPAAPVAGGGIALTPPVVALRPPGAPAPALADRGLPDDLVATRGLPGAPARDPQTGRPLEAGSAAPGPRVTRALPGAGVVGPAAAPPGQDPLPTFTAVAAADGPRPAGSRTASGEPYDPAALSAASRTLPFGAMLRIAYGARTVTVRVNDRARGRDLELSPAAATALGLPAVATVTVQLLPSGATSRSRR